MAYQRLMVECDGPLAIVKFNAPASMNALDEAMRRELPEAMGRLLDDDGIRAILLTGEGRAFCAGANLKNMYAEQSDGDTPDVGSSLRNGINPMLVRMAEANKPIIAAVNGAAVGVGCGLALSADIVLVGRSGYFFQSFIRLGVVPDGGSSWVIPRLIGRTRAAAMTMLGEKIDAETAVAWGLAYRMYEDSALMPAARAMASKLAHGPTVAYGKIKHLLRASLQNGLVDQIELEAAHQQTAFATEDCREGIAAFVEKREAAFKGR
ncbi:1,2-epoxyphenylacetyl-CoA isomerase [Alphaproteobacteria bacterium SO-S41]|nr:1,2-epoxyphenylacetyl-CoA isomerase [Alphaproteobacteria bacterium SO-S41]